MSVHRRDRDYLYDIWEAMHRIISYVRMRDKVVHEYFGINYDIVWTVISRDIPHVFPDIEAIRRQEGGSP